MKIPPYLLFSVLLASNAASAQTLTLDNLSFVHFDGSSQDFQIPSGTVDLSIQSAGPNQWTIQVSPGNVDIPAFAYPSGKQATWGLASLATGTAKRKGKSVDIDVDVVASITVSGEGTPAQFPLQFTTGTTTASRGSVTVSRTGVPLDTGSGYVQLVASGVNSDRAPTAPGKPFYIVLSGTMSGLPASFP